jgi:hypothetical protein
MEGGHLQLDMSPHDMRNQPYPSETLQRVRKFMGIGNSGIVHA